MSTRKSMTLPIIITLIFICIIIYLFMNIEQTVVTCEKNMTFDSDIKLAEIVVVNMDGKKITSMNITKRVTLPNHYPKKDSSLTAIRNSLNYTIEYLDKNATCSIVDDSVITEIGVSNNELVLLDNISFVDNNGEIGISINTNTKSSEVITLKVGDSYTDGEFMKFLKNKGYSCK